MDEPLCLMGIYFMETEIWKDVPDYKGYYQASSLGRIKSLDRKIKSSKGFRFAKSKILSPHKREKGYLQIVLCKEGNNRSIQIQIVVAMAFLNHKNNGNTLVVHHKNDIRTDNRVCNLEIISNRENVSLGYKNKSNKSTGVFFDAVKIVKKWRATININKTVYYLGYFKTELQASNAYNVALKKYNKNGTLPYKKP